MGSKKKILLIFGILLLGIIIIFAINQANQSAKPIKFGGKGEAHAIELANPSLNDLDQTPHNGHAQHEAKKEGGMNKLMVKLEGSASAPAWEASWAEAEHLNLEFEVANVQPITEVSLKIQVLDVAWKFDRVLVYSGSARAADPKTFCQFILEITEVGTGRTIYREPLVNGATTTKVEASSSGDNGNGTYVPSKPIRMKTSPRKYNLKLILEAKGSLSAGNDSYTIDGTADYSKIKMWVE